MHELSIAVSLVEVACEESERLGGVRVEALHVRVGPLSGIVKEALAFSFEIAAQGTPIEGSRLEIEDVPIRVFCTRCGEERTLESWQHFTCPVCREPTPEVRSGREMQLTALEVSRDAAEDR